METFANHLSSVEHITGSPLKSI